MSRQQRLAILGYHRVGPSPPGSRDTWFSVPEETFASHLRHLHDGGWRVIGFSELLAALDEPAALGPRTALLTFDDGYRTLRGAALRVLRDFGCPATCFVPTDFIGRRNLFDVENGEPEEAICSVDDLRALVAAGVAVQSHGASHTAFSALDAAARERELRVSREALEVALGTPVEAIAFPYGDVGRNGDELDASLRRNGYRLAFLYGGGSTRLPLADPYRLPRIAIGPDTDVAAELGNR